MLFHGDTPSLRFLELSSEYFTEGSETYFHLTNAFSSLPTAVWALNGKGTTINLGADGVYVPVCELERIR